MRPLFFLYDRAKSNVFKNVSSSTTLEEEDDDEEECATRSLQNLLNVRFIHAGKSIPLAKTDDGLVIASVVAFFAGALPSSTVSDDDFLSCFFVDDRRNAHNSHASCTEIAFTSSVLPLKHARKQK